MSRIAEIRTSTIKYTNDAAIEKAAAANADVPIAPEETHMIEDGELKIRRPVTVRRTAARHPSSSKAFARSRPYTTRDAGKTARALTQDLALVREFRHEIEGVIAVRQEDVCAMERQLALKNQISEADRLANEARLAQEAQLLDAKNRAIEADRLATEARLAQEAQLLEAKNRALEADRAAKDDAFIQETKMLELRRHAAEAERAAKERELAQDIAAKKEAFELETRGLEVKREKDAQDIAAKKEVLELDARGLEGLRRGVEYRASVGLGPAEKIPAPVLQLGTSSDKVTLSQWMDMTNKPAMPDGYPREFAIKASRRHAAMSNGRTPEKRARHYGMDSDHVNVYSPAEHGAMLEHLFWEVMALTPEEVAASNAVADAWKKAPAKDAAPRSIKVNVDVPMMNP
jgi:hypothetical protein